MNRTQQQTPPGLAAIYRYLRRIYPNQTNPLQVTALVKYWLNGPDPLDFVSMYDNPGDSILNVPPHWHYVSCGLSDLHGDGRIHEATQDDTGPSGYGFELTFRLRKMPGEEYPPTWPAELMQNLAKYVFKSEQMLCATDHISWHTPLNANDKMTNINQMLLSEDPQLHQLNTPFGYVNFMQIIGVFTEELQAAQQWNGLAVINLLRQIPEAGGHWFVTDMTRQKSIFQMNPRLREMVEIGIADEGSNLSGVSAKCWWGECSKDRIHEALATAHNNQYPERPTSSALSNRIRSSLQNYRNEAAVENERASRASNYSSVSELLKSRPITEGLQLRFNLEAAALLPLAIRGRLAHGRHFTFKGAQSDCAITFVSTDITGTSVDEKYPYAALQNWLQVLIPDDFLETLAHDFDQLQRRPDEISLPKLYAWPQRNLMITIVGDS
ncbi:suppressor of fused homolog [Clytia hemisphaerica]|uniref:Suppressor of fused homolog n=1 Tax=Clytia hemisphaerica TaxID=252671 RepID=A0A7M5V0C5_9CNID|eukprot:TCONS_00013505-protein